jgi:hypothetical protein
MIVPGGPPGNCMHPPAILLTAVDCKAADAFAAFTHRARFAASITSLVSALATARAAARPVELHACARADCYSSPAVWIRPVAAVTPNIALDLASLKAKNALRWFVLQDAVNKVRDLGSAVAALHKNLDPEKTPDGFEHAEFRVIYTGLGRSYAPTPPVPHGPYGSRSHALPPLQRRQRLRRRGRSAQVLVLGRDHSCHHDREASA